MHTSLQVAIILMWFSGQSFKKYTSNFMKTHPVGVK